MKFLPTVLLLFICIAAAATTQPAHGPDVVILKELVSLYEPVPFDHKTHAQMAEMWDGCTTCHHRSPAATTRPASTLEAHAKSQADAATVPACKSCHEITGKETNLLMPNLKGAYHRQCLNCHRDWSHENACGACHKERDKIAATTEPSTTAPSVDDIVGRMHPPIEAPRDHLYVARFTPAMGQNVLFRHEEHVKTFGIKCVSCHRRDNCANCHSAGASAATIPVSQRAVHPGRTWKDSHGPCASCHATDTCAHCHYDEKSKPPAAFSHQITGQMLDEDHTGLKCLQCHTNYKSKTDLTCGQSECHDKRAMVYPADLPGPKRVIKPATTKAAASTTTTTPATTRAVIKRIRR